MDESELQKHDILKVDKWIQDGRWIQPPLVWGMFTQWSSREVVKNIVNNTTLGTIFVIDGYAYHERITFDNLKTFLTSAYQNDTLLTLANVIQRTGDDLFVRIKNMLLQSDDTISNSFEQFLDTYLDFVGFWTVTTLMGNITSDLAKEVGYVSSEADLFEKVHPYLKKSWIEDDADEIKTIARSIIQSYYNSVDEAYSEPVIKQAIDDYRAKYIWSKISKWHIQELSSDDVKKRITEEVVNTKAGNNIPTVLGSSAQNDYPDGVVALCATSTYYRAQSTMMEMKTAYRLHSLLVSKICEPNNITFDELLLLTPGELANLFRTHTVTIQNIETVLKRKESFFCYKKDAIDVVCDVASDVYKKVYDTYVKHTMQEKVTILKGVPASKGNVTGRVAIINDASEFATFKDGEILVTVETSPTFVPLMRMAAAILTGRGGITSHAAIVSRELKKPCIIGIKDVTKILKTGDMVTVDANTGIVTIL